MKWCEIIEDVREKRGTWRLLQPLVVFVAAGMRHTEDYGSSPVFKSEWVKTALPPGTLISDQFHTWIAMRDDGESQFISMTDPDRDPHAHTRNPPLDQMERVATPRTLPIPKPIREGAKRVSVWGQTITVLVNPSIPEAVNLLSRVLRANEGECYLRGLIDSQGEALLWDGNLATHDDVRETMWPEHARYSSGWSGFEVVVDAENKDVGVTRAGDVDFDTNPHIKNIKRAVDIVTAKARTVMEGRDAYLYHGTELANAVAIVRDNMIDGYTEREHLPFAVSTTRDPRLAFDVGTWWDRMHPVVFVLDQRKLAQARKIVPHVDVDSDGEVWGYDREKSPTRQRGKESEERVIGSIKPLDRYLVSINVDPSFLARARRDETARYSVHETGNFKTSKEFLAALDAFSRHPKLNALPLPHGVAKMNAEYRKEQRYRGTKLQATGPLSPPVVPSRKPNLP
jgi:hypothetical protein